MKHKNILMIMVVVLGIMLTACSSSNNKEEAFEPTQTTKELMDSVLAQFEQPSLMELPAEMVNELYHLNPTLLDQYTIMTPMMNIKTNEIAILKVKDAKDIPTVEEAVKQRATDIQKQFETYLPDQYENARNYKLVTKGNYVIFIISENADDIEKAFETFFVKQ
ncbi:DUF4358 domain-containing protein [Paenibacillus anaericanus]|uniref:DUF4358 domain-containing protein n=1 Tax=Paenibacillus anaericanus TaxID=170367 RepID=A0A3S1D740_9BACL|nr:DUF4358 domain-containing protein [Paenibacillus anaericanus]RUT38512.1 DUF4358 domain-containing protein [Paenibacillus anaericanus]